MNTIVTRPAQTSDLNIINEIIASAVQTWSLPDRVKRLTIPSYQYTEQDLQHMEMIVATQDNDVVGVAAWEKIKSDLLLHGVYVDPQRHHQGIGAKLFACAQQAAIDGGQQGIMVKAQKGSEGFYSAMGMQTMAVNDERRDFENRFYKSL